ncbi:MULTISPECIES: TlpA family protein disulfide reductase [Mesonia]|uniref:Thiol-disulfide oxidoreductase ResA n=1 Tax=Mesonia oceanica TaxID=2687242 RepID=A0AC61YBA0_9FLAO|nr:MULTISPECIES: TlpA disulfide reductase family protein [Mesonia]MAN29118.1 thioredoxin [Mesonia sp.]MAQ41842.1 thioredoxin [Mesonia sp.]MBJ98350.1 thioredoxin [Flavobacteriaceae bacterium]VVV01786.1 Thiol-disulfide oxidoreductase ResA [Mesonia oceanica]|tara:strand:- start:10098 stop:11576 length:1479 start_codon:yes stop_codon:yes gene_type:complete
MNYYFKIIFIVLAINFVSCEKEKDFVVINGKISGDIPQQIEYSLPINGIDFFGIKDSVQPDSLGNFKIKLQLEKTSFVEFFNDLKYYGTLITEPHKNYNIQINIRDSIDFNVQGKTSQAQKTYNKLSSKTLLDGYFSEESSKYKTDSIAKNIKEKINKNKNKELAQFQQLYKQKKISNNFYQLIKNDREYYYAGALVDIGYNNYRLDKLGRNKLTEKEYSKLLRDAYKIKPATNENLMSSPWFYFYTQLFLIYKDYYEEKNSVEDIGRMMASGKYNSHFMNLANKYLPQSNYEYFFAAHLIFVSTYNNFEKELIDLFEVFKKEFPNSPYTNYVKTYIAPVIAYHEKQKEDFNKDTIFLDHQKFTSLNSIAQELQSERIYVDIWASWCAPCKEEFKHSDDLYNLLQSNNIPVVYISIDEENRVTQWKEIIKFFNLKGYHLRAEKALVDELKELKGTKNFGVPWHFVIDSEGNIIEKYVDGASNTTKLKSQLKL